MPTREIRIRGATPLVVAARDVLELLERSDAQRLLAEVIEVRQRDRALRQLLEDLEGGRR